MLPSMVIMALILFLAAFINAFAYFPPLVSPPISPWPKSIRFVSIQEKIAIVGPNFKAGWTHDKMVRPNGEKLFLMTEGYLPKGGELRIYVPEKGGKKGK